VTTDRTFDVINPATAQVIAKVPEADAASIDRALSSARSGFECWSAKSHAERKEIILRYADLLERDNERIIDLLVEETGKPFGDAMYDTAMVSNCLRFFIEEAERLDQPIIQDPDGRFLNYIQRQPLGVTVGFLAWNFPLLNVGYKLGPVLASGCSTIIKPSSVTPLASLEVAKLAIEAGVPPGVINMVTSTDRGLCESLLTSDIPALVTMIGSTEAGLKVMKASCSSVKHFSMELGGNAPVLIYPDADLESAVNHVVGLKFANCGQICVAPNRCFVHKSIYDSFIEAAAKVAAMFQFGSGRQEGMLIGPLSSDGARQGVLKVVQSAVDAGAEIVCGGGCPERDGYFMEPTILRGVTPDMTVAKEEIFGPVLPVIAFGEDDDEIAMANNVSHGLAAYVFTSDLSSGLRAARDIEAGSVCVNEPHYAVHLPHGGLKQSGVGKDCSRFSLEEYLTIKRISVLL
jgi:acyl-CoA reductase-like NAD-dependent aldehyde dehydrogenase